MGKFLFLVALLAGIVTVSYIGIDPSLFPVDDARVETSPVATESGAIYAAGVVEGATPDIELRSEIVGRIVDILVDEGDIVDAGDVLLRLDDRQQIAAVSLAQADLQLAVAERVEAENILQAKSSELRRAELEWSRTEQLLKEKATSQRVADNQRMTVDSLRAELAAVAARVEPTEAGVSLAQARILAAESRLELAKIMLDKTVIKAPSKGRILAINAEVGELTNVAEISEPLVVLTDDSVIHIRAFVEEFDAAKITVGTKAQLLSDGLVDQKISGEIIWASPRMTPKQLWRNKSEELFDVKTREILIRCPDNPGLVIGLDLDVVIGR